MENVLEIKEKILNTIKKIGPSLPVQLARTIEKNSIITSAFLSELFSEQSIKISKLKVGGSPLYFIPGQEKELEKFSHHLPGKEKEAYELLKENGILRDDEQEPAIRVALRQIKDFSFPVVLKQQDKQIIFWRYLTITQKQAEEKITEKLEKPKKKKEISKPKEEKKKESKILDKKSQERLEINKEIPKQKIKISDEKDRQNKELAKEKPKKKEKSEFVKKILYFLEKEDIELIREKEIKKREFSAIVRIDTQLGKGKMFLIAKDKKKITENDLRVALQKSQVEKMLALIITPGEINKKAKEYLEEYQDLIKILKLE